MSTADPASAPANHLRRSSEPPTPAPPSSPALSAQRQTRLATVSQGAVTAPLRAPSLHRRLSSSAASTTAHLEPPPPSTPPSDAPVQPLNLPRLAQGVVPSRSGSVLSRGLVLKADYRYVAENAPPTSGAHGLNLSGVSNFRDSGLGVWGCAQPTATGVRSILAVLRAKKGPGAKGEGREVVWLGTREEPLLYIGGQPYVLREASHPTRTYSISDRPENLEDIEGRLKQDILREAARYGGLVLIHSESPSGGLQPNWIAVDEVQTAKELFTSLRTAGYSVTYYRTPVARDQSPQAYLDLYTSLLSKVPTSTSLVFNCGAGVVRSTFATSVALLVRRKQLIDEGRGDPYAAVLEKGASVGGTEVEFGGAAKVLRAQSEQASRDRSLLKLMHVLAKSLPIEQQGSVLGLLSAQSSLLENLRSALLGNFDIILSLLSCLDDGAAAKKAVDVVSDRNDAVVHLRESILIHRVKYASCALSDSAKAASLRSTALAALERYFFLIAFSAYVSEASLSTRLPFSSWLRRRPEIAKMVGRLKKTGGSDGGFKMFAPVEDLSAIARGETGAGAMVGKGGQGGQPGDEWVDQIVRNRSGIILRSSFILKNDQWLNLAEGQTESQVVKGVVNYRRVPETLLYGLSQPTEEGIRRVLEHIKSDIKPTATIVVINVREEPLVYVSSTPYVLRSQAVSLRNPKIYSGISSARLELLESRLKSDVLAELRAFEGRLLVATETEDGTVLPSWEHVANEGQVKTMREMMDAVGEEVAGEKFRFLRVAITPEASPDFTDLRDIIQTVTQLDPNDAVLVSDQLGRGRATRTLIVIYLLREWMQNGKFTAPRSERPGYTVINNLLRVVRNGFEVKNAVDAAITACSDPFDLLGAVEHARQQAEDSEGETRQRWIGRGVRELRAYFFLILFATHLYEAKPSNWSELGNSYEEFVRSRPVFATIGKELDNASIDALLPLQRTRGEIGTGSASTDEVAEFVRGRNGNILSSMTLLKSDFFSNLQKMSLPERIEGQPNFRRVVLSVAGIARGARTPSVSSATAPAFSFTTATGATTTEGVDSVGPCVYGSGMPTLDGLRRMLEKIEAKKTSVFWHLLREEPVLYISGRPHVLRLFDQPLENVITTGVTTAAVEAMEEELRKDVLRELKRTGGKVLLHDEIEKDGQFIVTAMWEEVKPEDILTPRETWSKMKEEGFKVDYDRLPVTDEQAPIASIFSRIEQRVSSALTVHASASAERNDVSFGWNCQMGRGRTTTGMVACALVHRILFNPTRQGSHPNPDLAASFLLPLPADDSTSSHTTHWDGRESEPYLEGEYKIVLQLIGVLGQGKVAKRLTDRAIDDMEAVQNLRTAIFAFKQRAEAAEEGSKKREKLTDQALNYLYRYATLIIFAAFLLEKAAYLSSTSTASDDDSDDDERSGVRRSAFPSFEQYLQQKSEIRKILARRTLE